MFLTLTSLTGLNYLKLKGVYTDVFILHDRPSTLHRRKAFKEKDEDTVRRNLIPFS